MNLKKRLFVSLLSSFCIAHSLEASKKTAIYEMKMLENIFHSKIKKKKNSQISHFKISLCRKTVSLLPTGRDVILQQTNVFLQDSGFRGFSPLQASHHRRGVDVTDSHLLQEEVNHRGVVVAMATPEYVFIRLTGVCSCSNTPTVSKLRKTKICYSMYSRSVVLSRWSLRTDIFF